VEWNRTLDVLEVPLIVMDTTLKVYRKMSPDTAEERILELAKRCQEVGGVFTLLWHNTSLSGDWLPWGEMYERVVRLLAGMLREDSGYT
jgi:hypothetical protein